MAAQMGQEITDQIKSRRLVYIILFLRSEGQVENIESREMSKEQGE